jgi:N-carbamoyl-L-amino-acid hydrolase
MARNLKINSDRLWSTIMTSGEIGRGPKGGLRRLTLTDEDRDVRNLLASWARADGFSVTVDQIGNMFIRRDGTDPALAPVLIGSHLDTQAAGGSFDGVLGVLAGLEVLRVLNEAGISTRRAIEVVNWTNEEGARFYPPMLASAVFAGKQGLEWALDRCDRNGIRLGDELKRIGYSGKEPVGGRAVDAYFELHIEQGPRLDRERVPVGIVVGGFPTAGMRISIMGETAHVGPTPMELRRNALVGAAHVAIAIDEIGWRHSAAEAKATAARLDLWPNLPGIISDRADLFCDMRHPRADGLKRMLDEVAVALPDCARRGRCTIEIAEQWGFGGLEFDAELIALLRRAASDLGYRTLDLRSEAGHDAYHMASICPAAMIFSPCAGGISHNEAESMTKEDATPGANVLLSAVIARADR